MSGHSDWKSTAAAYGELMRKRALGEVEEMGQVRQLVKLLAPYYAKGISVLDVGCGAGHFFRSLRRIDPNIRYHGVDINGRYIRIAREAFAEFPGASFEARGVNKLAGLPSKSFDLSLNYMVLPFIHDFKATLREQLRITSRAVFVRLMLGDHTCIVKRYKWADRKCFYYNTYGRDEFVEFCRANGARKITVLDDDFTLDIPYRNAWDTYTHHGLQISGNIVLEWKVVVIEL